MKATKSYFTESFSVDTFKEERTMDTFPIRPKFTEQAATFYSNLISRYFFNNYLQFTIAVKQFLNTPESKSYYSEFFECSFIIPPKQPVKLSSEEKNK